MKGLLHRGCGGWYCVLRCGAVVEAIVRCRDDEMLFNKVSGLKLGCAVEAKDDDPVENVVGPFAAGQQGGLSTETCQQSGDLTVTPSDQRVGAVGLGAEEGHELARSLRTDRGVEPQSGGFA